jgi:hypothetical protein
MLPDTTTELNAHFATLRVHAASGLQDILVFAEEMKTKTDTLPDDLKPTVEVLNKICMEALITSFAERLKLISELSFQEMSRTALTPKHSGTPDERKRSTSNAI